MPYVMGFNISARDERILEILLSYRGVTAKQMTILLTKSRAYSLSEEKSVYNSLRKLKNQGLIAAHKLHETVANGSLYHLTSKGYTFTLDLMNVENGKTCEGWLPQDPYIDSGFADIPYEVFSPPKKQTAHHLMLIDFFINVIDLNDDVVQPIPHRLNIYSSQTYDYPGERYMQTRKFRPDGEIMINSKRYAIEIDRAMESHEQLVQKFEVYKGYLDHCKKKNELQPLHGIIFVVEDRKRSHGMKKRWASLLAAYSKTLYPDWSGVHLILTSMSLVKQTILDEQSILRNDYSSSCSRMDTILKDLKLTTHTTDFSRQVEDIREHVFTSGYTPESECFIYNCIPCQEFDSRMLMGVLEHQNTVTYNMKKNAQAYTKGHKYMGASTFVCYSDKWRKPAIVDLTQFGVIGRISNVFKQPSDFISFYHDKSIRGDTGKSYIKDYGLSVFNED